MNQARQIRQNHFSESGAALLIAIFALMLISVVAIALVVSQGTDSALAGNYRTSVGAYYAGVAGLEEARGRLLWKTGKCFVNSPAAPACPDPLFIPMSGSYVPTMSLTDVRYIVNPASGETVDPLSGTYQDTEYETEFGFPPSSTPLTIASIWPVASLSGPSYKWVRISPATEKSLQIDVNNDGILDSATPLLYDPAAVGTGAPPPPTPSLLLPPASSSGTASQALEITSLAVLPSGGRRILQYVVAPLTISTVVSVQPPNPPLVGNLNFPAALTLLGSGSTYSSASFQINGQTSGCNSVIVPTIGLTNGTAAPTGYHGTTADVTALVRRSWQTPASLDAVIQDIIKNADYVFQGNTNATSFNTLGMSPTSAPLTIVVNGNLNMTSWPRVGTGVLVVTGTFTFDANMTWEGTILVIGRGKVDFISNGFGGGIDGAMVVAETRGFGNTLLPGLNLGAASFRETGGAGATGRGLNYSSCSINPGVTPSNPAGTPAPLGYKILSFREIQSN